MPSNDLADAILRDFATLFARVRFPVTNIEDWYAAWHGANMELLLVRAGTYLPYHGHRADVEAAMLEIASAYMSLPSSVANEFALPFGIFCLWSIFFTQRSEPRMQAPISVSAVELATDRLTRVGGRHAERQMSALLRSLLNTLSEHQAFCLLPYTQGVYPMRILSVHEATPGASLLRQGVVERFGNSQSAPVTALSAGGNGGANAVPIFDTSELDQALVRYNNLACVLGL